MTFCQHNIHTFQNSGHSPACHNKKNRLITWDIKKKKQNTLALRSWGRGLKTGPLHLWGSSNELRSSWSKQWSLQRACCTVERHPSEYMWENLKYNEVNPITIPHLLISKPNFFQTQSLGAINNNSIAYRVERLGSSQTAYHSITRQLQIWIKICVICNCNDHCRHYFSIVI